MTVYIYRCVTCGFKAQLPSYRGERFDDDYCPQGCGHSPTGPGRKVRWVYVRVK